VSPANSCSPAVAARSCVEILGMPNSGKSGLARRLSGRTVGSRTVVNIGSRGAAIVGNLNRTAFHLRSLESMRRLVLTNAQSGRLILLDRGFHDKLLLYGLLEAWGIVDAELVCRCREIMLELSWAEVPFIVLTVNQTVMLSREPPTYGDKRARWRPLLGEDVKGRLECLHHAYLSLPTTQSMLRLDGTVAPEICDASALAFLESVCRT
jgi:hypothetical protein